MSLRPALRAALVVSGLSAAACGGSQAASPEPASNASNGSGSSSNGSMSNGTADTTTAACDPNVEPTTQACCETVGGRMWNAAGATCVWAVPAGPFVPPSMTG